MAYCRYCNKEITWLQEGRKRVPVEGDGAVHQCEEFTKSRKSIRQVERSEIDPDILKQYEQAINNKK
jgi:hypothetical protein